MNRPTPEQQAAVDRFRGKHGRRWKAWLRCCWTNGNYPIYANENGDAALLQQVRNTLGPAWLEKEART